MINKARLRNILKKTRIDILELHLIYNYLTINNIDFSYNQILKDYFRDFCFDSSLLEEVSILEVQSLKELENYLELLIPVDDRKMNGAFFTPDYIVNYIINELKPQENDLNLDPSCGCGAFLIGLVEYYRINFNKSVKKTISENIFGSDILDYNIRRSKLLLTIYALKNNENLIESDFNLFHQDSLKASWKGQFNNVVGNPPYVKFQDLSEDYRSYLMKWSTIDFGTFNLYFAFFELGYKLLKSEGKLGYISPNNYFTSLSGEALRRFFTKNRCVYKIIDFNHKKVFDAQTYTSLTFLNKKQNETILFDRISEKYDPKEFLQNVKCSINRYEHLNDKKWRLLKADEQENIRIIETIGTPIGQMFDICVGIATLKDDIFFIDGSNKKASLYLKTTDKGSFEIEEDITKPVYKISDFKNQGSIQSNQRRIICPYTIKKETVTPIPENELKTKFPKCYEYLLSEKSNLQSRDKGKSSFEPFYVWGRTQGLAKFGKKLLTPTFSQRPRFLLVNEEEAYFTNGYGIFFRNSDSNLLFDTINPITKSENIEVVQKILNSIVMHYYISKTSVSIEGGYPCYQKNFIEKFSIPEFTEAEIHIISNSNSDEVDNFLVNRYHLSFEGIENYM